MFSEYAAPVWLVHSQDNPEPGGRTSPFPQAFPHL